MEVKDGGLPDEKMNGKRERDLHAISRTDERA